MLGMLGFGPWPLKAKIFGLGLEVLGLAAQGLATQGLGLELGTQALLRDIFFFTGCL